MTPSSAARRQRTSCPGPTAASTGCSARQRSTTRPATVGEGAGSVYDLRWRQSRDADHRRSLVEARSRVYQGGRVGMPCRGVQRRGGGALDDLPSVHDGKLVADGREQGEVVADRERCGSLVRTSSRMRRDICACVVTSRPVVGSSSTSTDLLRRHGDRERDPLLLAARELVREARQRELRLGDPDLLGSWSARAWRARPARPRWSSRAGSRAGAGRDAAVERLRGVLGDVRDLLSPDRPQRRNRQGEQVDSVQQGAAGRGVRCPGSESRSPTGRPSTSRSRTHRRGRGSDRARERDRRRGRRRSARRRRSRSRR